MECIRHIFYKMFPKKWAVKGPLIKIIVLKGKIKNQELKKQIGTDVDIPPQESRNNGNTARFLATLPYFQALQGLTS